MALFKHEIPILERDDAQDAVIMPGRHGLKYPEKAAFLFLGSAVDAYAAGCEVLNNYETITKTFPIYRATHRGEEICVCQAPLGAPAAVQLLDHLIGCGVRKIVSAGSCGALVPIAENEFMVPVKALRAEGTSYHYLPPERFVELDPGAVDAVRRALIADGVKVRECVTWTTDAFYRETHDMILHRRAEGCETVDMECAALAACAKFRKAAFAQILFTADSLADTGNYDEREWGTASFGRALKLALDALVQM